MKASKKGNELEEYLKKINAYAEEKNESITTGFPQLDEIVCNGFPLGRSVEIYGDESGGKSSLALAMCGEFIRQGKRVVWVDVEDSYTKEYAESLGVDTSKLSVMVGLETGEQTLAALEEIIEKGSTDVVVIDSMSEVVPRTWLENDLETLPIGRRASLHGRFFLHTKTDRIGNDVMLILINQTRNDPRDTSMFKSRKSTAGTTTLHEVKARIRVMRSGQIKKGDDLVGYFYKAEVTKNKVGPVKGTCTFRYRLKGGFDKDWDLLDMAVAKGVVKKEGASFSIEGEKIAFGEENAVQAIKDSPELKELIKSKLI